MTLIAKHMGPVYVPEPILEEIDGFNHRDCSSLRLQVEESILEDHLFAAGKPVPGLSEKDLICLHTAIRLKAVCITNDSLLRKTCRDYHLDTMWGFRPMLQLVKMGLLDGDEALNIAKTIQEQNNWIAASVLDQFAKQLGKLGKLSGGKKGKRPRRRKK